MMKTEKFYYFIGIHTPEILALISSMIIFISGIYLAFSIDPLWLNRSGALIIIIGILLATSRFHERIAQKVLNSIKNNPEISSLEALDIYEQQIETSLPKEEQNLFLHRFQEIIVKNVNSKEWRKEYISSTVEPTIHRIKLWEIFLVIGGTFLNGFGDYIIFVFKAVVKI